MTNNIAFGIVIGLLFVCLVVLFCILLVKLYINKIKNYTKLIYQKDIDFQKTLNTAMVETQEQVLNNISRDLHDDAGQQITYINFQLENLKLDAPETQELLEPISVSLIQLSQSVRSISHSLNNQLLLQQDLIRAIETEAERLGRHPKTVLHFAVNGIREKEFTSEEKIIIYRIFQEITNNCFKHAKATIIDINIQQQPFFELRIRDNGKGFDPKCLENEKPTLGLQNMKSRATIINYTIDITSVPNEGTTIILSEKQ